jgi:hypothetical protein
MSGREQWRRKQITRAFTATITTADGEQFTTTVHGSNAYDAERTAELERPGATVIVRSEQR